MPDADDELLDRASRFAFEQARADHLARPRRPVPSALRRHVGFSRTPPATLRVVRRIIDDDDEFRLRVAEKATEAEVGRAGMLWLTHPEGWESDLDALRGFLAGELEETAERSHAAGLERQLDAVRAELTELRAAQTPLVESLTEAERARAEADAESLETQTELAELRHERNHAVREWKRIERMRNEEKAEVAAARALLDQTDRGDAGDGSDAIVEHETQRHVHDRVRAARRALADVEGEMAVLRSDLADAEDRLTTALDGVARTLDELAEPLAPPVAPADPVPAPAGPPARRVPPPLGRGLIDDTVEAAEALVRLPAVTVLIDGYNLTLGALPELSLADGRDRLIAALDQLHARTGARSLVVFDGSEPGTGGGRSRWVQVRFTDHAVEADDVLIGLVASWSSPGPLVVVSSDKRVHEGVRRGGARPLASAAFAELLGLG